MYVNQYMHSHICYSKQVGCSLTWWCIQVVTDYFVATLTFQVTAVPSVMAVKDGVVMASFVGVLDDDKLKAFVNKLIGE